MTTIGTALSATQVGIARLGAGAAHDGAAAVLYSPPLPGTIDDQTADIQPIASAEAGNTDSGGKSGGKYFTPSFPVRYDPTSPEANSLGMVAIPTVEPVQAVVEQISAKQAYEAKPVATPSVADKENSAMSVWI